MGNLLQEQLEGKHKTLTKWLLAIRETIETGEPVKIDGGTYDPDTIMDMFTAVVCYHTVVSENAIIAQLVGGGPAIDWLIVVINGHLWYTALMGLDWDTPRKAFYEADPVLWDLAQMVLEYYGLDQVED